MEAAIIAAVGEFFGGAFNWFGQISSNNALDKQGEITEEQTSQVFYSGMFSNQQSTEATNRRTLLVVGTVFVALIVSITLIYRKK